MYAKIGADFSTPMVQQNLYDVKRFIIYLYYVLLRVDDFEDIVATCENVSVQPFS